MNISAGFPEHRRWRSDDSPLPLQQRADERYLAGQCLQGDAAGDEHLDPVYQLARRRLLSELASLSEGVEGLHRLAQQLRFDVREMDPDDLLHQFGAGELDVVEDAAPQKGVR